MASFSLSRASSFIAAASARFLASLSAAFERVDDDLEDLVVVVVVEGMLLP